MAKKSAPRTISPDKVKVSWGTVCQEVGFRDNLYRTCREKIPNFTGLGLSRYDHEEEDLGEDFGKLLRQSAKDIPPPPPEDWKFEPEGLAEQLLYGNKVKFAIYGSLAALVYWFFLKDKLAALLAKMPAAAAPKPVQKPGVISRGTTAKAA